MGHLVAHVSRAGDDAKGDADRENDCVVEVDEMTKQFQ